MVNLRGLWRSGADLFTAHPRVGLAVRTAVAAALAWFVVRLIPGTVDYPYYAPLGAVAATSLSVVSTMRHTLRAGLAVVLGAAIGLAARELLPSGVWTVAAVVAVGVLVAGLRWLDDLGAWVPTAALFVLILGGREPMHYPATYAGLVLLGGLIGTLVALAFPQLPLTPTERALARLRTALVEQLDQLAAGLEADELPDRDGWARRMIPLDHWRWATRQALQETEEARSWNLRAARWHTRLERVGRQVRACERAAWLVQDLAEIISGDELNGNDVVGLGPHIRPQTATVLHTVSGMFDSLSEGGINPDEIAAAHDALDTLAERVGDARTPSPDGFHVASNVVNSIRRLVLLLRDLATAETADQTFGTQQTG